MGERGGGADAAGLPYCIYSGRVCWGEGGGGRGSRSVLVLDVVCIHLVSHYVSLSHISVLL
jgi:hypothetical protein